MISDRVPNPIALNPSVYGSEEQPLGLVYFYF
jgi:hypothetical protein